MSSIEITPHHFLLLKPGPRVKESPLASNDVLLEVSRISLQRMHGLATAATHRSFTPAVLGDLQLYGGPGMELAPLADVYPSANRPSTAPMSSAALAAAFTFAPGTSVLPAAAKGELVVSAWGGAAAAPGGGGRVITGIRVKLKKEKKDKDRDRKKKDKKRKHDPTASAGTQ